MLELHEISAFKCLILEYSEGKRFKNLTVNISTILLKGNKTQRVLGSKVQVVGESGQSELQDFSQVASDLNHTTRCS